MLRRTLSPGHSPPRLRFRGPNLHVPLWLLAAGAVLTGLARAVVWLVLHPRTAAALAGCVLAWAVWLRWGWGPYGWAAATLGVHLGVWWARWPGSFHRQVTARLRSRWRRFGYWREWQPAMVTSGLALTPALGASLPVLGSVRSEEGRDVMRVRMLPGQTLEQWQAAAPRLATTFDVRAVRVRRVPGRPQQLDLICLRRAVPAAEVPTKIENLEVSAVTEPAPVDDPPPVAPRPGAFPRAPRRAS